MKQRRSLMYIASFLALTIPTPGRFVFGFTLIACCGDIVPLLLSFEEVGIEPVVP